MPRSKPFSGKQKKQQLKNKKATKSSKPEKDPTDALFDKIQENEAKLEAVKQKAENTKNLNLKISQTFDEQEKNKTLLSQLPVDSIETIQNSFGRFFLKIGKLSKTEVEERKLFCRSNFYNVNQSQKSFKFRKIDWPNFPTRPKWHKRMTPEQLENSEKEYFVEFLQNLNLVEKMKNPTTPKSVQQDTKDKANEEDSSEGPDEKVAESEPRVASPVKSVTALNRFEHNLETWRQLWRVIEKANTLAIVVDSRFPHLTLSDSLLQFLKGYEPKKHVILILNKIDLIPVEVVRLRGIKG